MTEKKANRTERPDSEVKPPVQRRHFSKAEKLRILNEAEACRERGEIGALVRREGIYSSYLSRWREARDRGELSGSKSKKRGPKTDINQDQAKENARLRQENERLRARLQQAETVIEVQKKLSQILGLETSTQENTRPE